MRLQPGDIMACYGTGAISWAIRLRTTWPFAPAGLRMAPSHVALIADLHWADGTKRISWVESTDDDLPACRVLGRKVEGVQVHHPADRVRQYLAEGGRVACYRLTDLAAFTAAESLDLSRKIQAIVGRPYDTDGALMAGTSLLKRLLYWRPASLNQLFCSETVAAVLMNLSRLNRCNPGDMHPAALLRELVRTGTYRFSHWVTHSQLEGPVPCDC